jgi:hypothetical protein
MQKVFVIAVVILASHFFNKAQAQLPEKKLDSLLTASFQPKESYSIDHQTVYSHWYFTKLFALFGAPFALHAVSETRFFAPGAPSSVWVEFIKDRAGKVTHMIVNQNELNTWSRISD